MANSLLLKTLLKSAMPTVKKLVENGKIDSFLQSIKKQYAGSEELMTGETVEILITTEIDGCEYANVVVLTPELTVKKLLKQQRMSDLIISLFNQSEIE